MEKYAKIFRGPEPTENSKKHGEKSIGRFSYIKRNIFPCWDGQLHLKSISRCHPGAGYYISTTLIYIEIIECYYKPPPIFLFCFSVMHIFQVSSCNSQLSVLTEGYKSALSAPLTSPCNCLLLQSCKIQLADWRAQ